MKICLGMIGVSAIAIVFFSFGAASAQTSDESDHPDSWTIRSLAPIISQWDFNGDDSIGSAQPRAYITANGYTAVSSDMPTGRYAIDLNQSTGCGTSCLYQEVDLQRETSRTPNSPAFTAYFTSFRPLPELILDPAFVIELNEEFVGEADAFILLGNQTEYRLMRWLDREAFKFESIRPACAAETGAEIIQDQNRRLLGPWGFDSYCLVETRDELQAVIQASLAASPAGSGYFIWQFDPVD